MRLTSLAFAFALLMAGPAFGSRLFDTWRMNPGDRPEGVHGWMAYLQTLADELRYAPNCNGELILMQKARFPVFAAEIPEVRTALELYRNHDESFVRLIARVWLADTYEDALDLLTLPDDGCTDQLWWQIRNRLMGLARVHGEKANPARHPALFAAAKAKNMVPLEVWGRFAHLEESAMGGCVSYPALLVELDGDWHTLN